MPPTLVKTLQTRHGPMLALPNDRFITRCLERYGELSPEEWKLLAQIIKPGMTVVEVGSNIGAHTVPMARACAPGLFYAFEPQRRVFQILCANLALNDIVNVVASPDACGAEAAGATVPPLDYASAKNFGGVSLGLPGEAGEVVRVRPLDDLGLPECGLIKVDVEGFEADVIRGAAATIARCRPVLYVENDRRGHQRSLIRQIHLMGYALYWHLPRLVERDNFNGVTDVEPEYGTGSINMVCLPRERIVPTDLEPIDPDDPRTSQRLDPDRRPVS